MKSSFKPYLLVGVGVVNVVHALMHLYQFIASLFIATQIHSHHPEGWLGSLIVGVFGLMSLVIGILPPPLQVYTMTTGPELFKELDDLLKHAAEQEINLSSPQAREHLVKSIFTVCKNYLLIDNLLDQNDDDQ